MNWTRQNTLPALLALLCISLGTAGCTKLRARDQLNKGVQAYREARYEAAIDHFKQAVTFDPTLLNARLYLATAYANQFVPGLDSDKNREVASQSIAVFEEVLRDDPGNLGSIQGIANLYFQMKEMDKAKEFYRKEIGLNPNSPEAHYSVGVINWTQTYQPRMKLKNDLKLRPDEPIKDAKARAALAEQNMPLVEEGLQSLSKAIELRPDYDDAMAYLNLMYREKADLVEDPAEREENLKAADEWIEKTLAVKKEKAQKAETHGTTGG